MLVDTHCHLNHEQLAGDVPACLERAAVAEVQQMIVVGYDMPSSEQAIRLAEAHPGVLYAAVGVHPHDSKDWDESAAERLRAMAANPLVVAIGEIGLDFHYDFSPRGDQYAAFRAQMRLAREVALPVVIHCREAYPECAELLRTEGVQETGGVMHCWAGTEQDAETITALGMHFGFGGTLTFKNAHEVRAVAQNAQTESLLIETDAPYLAPVPYRGKRNEPAYTALVAEKLAELRGVTNMEIAAISTANAHRLFPRLQGEL